MKDLAAPVSAIPTRVQRIEWAGEGTIALELRSVDGQPLPAFTPGAHIDLHLGNGLVRSYSLCSDSAETKSYVVAVALDAMSRGGSQYIHDTLRVGQTLTIQGPRNHFPLVEDASEVVFIAGGIGITPLLCMMRRLAKLDRPFTVYYATRTRDRAAFLNDIEAFGRPVHLHCDAEQGGAPLPLSDILARVAPGAHLYCCGPTPMLEAFEAACAARPAANVHVEYFKPKTELLNAPKDSFSVSLSNGQSFDIPTDRSILEVLIENGINPDYSCMDGVCGSCETKVLDGVPDHRDSLLTPSEQASNKTMMICVSRCKGDRLVLDIG